MKNHITTSGQDDGKRPVYRADGHVVGFAQNNIFCKQVSAAKHLLHKPLGWACDRDILDQEVAHGATAVLIMDKDSGNHYQAPIEAFAEYGIPLNRGFGDQMVLPMPRWTVKCFQKPNQPHQLGFNLGGGGLG